MCLIVILWLFVMWSLLSFFRLGDFKLIKGGAGVFNGWYPLPKLDDRNYTQLYAEDNLKAPEFMLFNVKGEDERTTEFMLFGVKTNNRRTPEFMPFSKVRTVERFPLCPWVSRVTMTETETLELKI